MPFSFILQPVFGCYMDLGNPDAEVRDYAVKTLKKCLAYSKEAGVGSIENKPEMLPVAPFFQHIRHRFQVFKRMPVYRLNCQQTLKMERIAP